MLSKPNAKNVLLPIILCIATKEGNKLTEILEILSLLYCVHKQNLISMHKL